MKSLFAVFSPSKGTPLDNSIIENKSKVIVFETTQKELSDGNVRISALIVDEWGHVLMVPFSTLAIIGTAPDTWEVGSLKNINEEQSVETLDVLQD